MVDVAEDAMDSLMQRNELQELQTKHELAHEGHDDHDKAEPSGTESGSPTLDPSRPDHDENTVSGAAPSR